MHCCVPAADCEFDYYVLQLLYIYNILYVHVYSRCLLISSVEGYNEDYDYHSVVEVHNNTMY